MSAHETDTVCGNVKGRPCRAGAAMAGSVGQGPQACSPGSGRSEGADLLAPQNNGFLSRFGPAVACWLQVGVVGL